ncbi:MAG: UDP-3-O-acyl-N-acetylglucosamine deacetylase [Candidatus Coatesbacteria bacterium]|nr:UDP-3-O-acyl-N-acetylglucosamine deacetylase [Candidatus Coatesbacteria bacterium]
MNYMITKNDCMQKTLERCVSCTGIGLHLGERVRMRLCPAPADTGIVFRRLDLDGRTVSACLRNVADVFYATSIKDGDVEVQTVEHLLAAFSAMGIDNAMVELDAKEVPILDGSAAPLVFLIKEAGVRTLDVPRRCIVIKEPIRVEADGKWLAIHPSDHLRISYTIDFHHPAIPKQSCSYAITKDEFIKELAPARTFGFLSEIRQLMKMGLAQGGCLDNAIVVNDHRILNPYLRFRDEFVRHKALDLLGDLALLGAPVLGHVVAHRAGHSMHTALVGAILQDHENWYEAELSRATLEMVAAQNASQPNRRWEEAYLTA